MSGAKRTPEPNLADDVTDTAPQAQQHVAQPRPARVHVVAGPQRLGDLIERGHAAVGDDDSDEPLRVSWRDLDHTGGVFDDDRAADDPHATTCGRCLSQRLCPRWLWASHRPQIRHVTRGAAQQLLQLLGGTTLAERVEPAEAEPEELALR